MSNEDSGLNEKPLEFFSSMGSSGGYCDGQAVIPDGDHYRAYCSCGQWEIQAPTQEDGLHQCRVHTGSVPA